MPYQPETLTLEANILGAGGTVTTAELNAIDALIVTLNTAGIKTKLKELHVPVGNGATAARERLLFLGAAHTSSALASFNSVTGAVGRVTSAAVASTDYNYTSFSMGVLFGAGLTGVPSFTTLFGGNGTDFNFFTLDWQAFAPTYNKLTIGAQTICIAPVLNPSDQLGDTMLWKPTFDGLLSMSGNASEYFSARDGEVTSYVPAILYATPPGVNPIYLPYENSASWHASFMGQYLTRAEIATLATAIRTCCTALGRTIPAKKAERLCFIGDSRVYSTQVSAYPYPETIYKQISDLFNPIAEVWDCGYSGVSWGAINSGAALFPNAPNWLAIGASRTTGPRVGRLAIVWCAANDLLGGTTAAVTKSRADTGIGNIKAAGWCPVYISEPSAYLGSAGDAAGFNTLVGADGSYTDGTRSYCVYRIDQNPRLICSDLGFFGMPVTAPGGGTDVTVPVNHGYNVGEETEWSALVGGGGLALATTYYVVNATATTIRVSATLGGAAINVATAMSGKIQRSRKCTASAGNATITMDRPHDYATGDEVQYVRINGGSGFLVGTRYYVTVLNATQIQLSASLGGPQIIPGTAIIADSVLLREATTFDGIHFTELGYAKIAAGLNSLMSAVGLFATAVPQAAPNPQSATTTAPFSYQILIDPFYGPTFGPYTYSAINLPAGVTCNAATGLISGTASVPGAYNVIFYITNDNGPGIGGFTLNVTGVPPAMTSGTAAFGNVRSPFVWPLAATGSPTSWAASPLPAGLTIDTLTGIISGTPLFTGVTIANVSASNAYGTSPTQLLTISIGPSLGYNPYPPNEAIPIWNQPLPVPAA